MKSARSTPPVLPVPLKEQDRCRQRLSIWVRSRLPESLGRAGGEPNGTLNAQRMSNGQLQQLSWHYQGDYRLHGRTTGRWSFAGQTELQEGVVLFSGAFERDAEGGLLYRFDLEWAFLQT